MSNRELRDLGIERADIDRVARTAFARQDDDPGRLFAKRPASPADALLFFAALASG